MKLSEHFTLAELTASQTAVRRRLDNTPPPAVIDNLRRLAGVLEQVRALAGAPLLVSSGYRSPAVNLAVGGAQRPPSAHMLGLAADFTVAGWRLARLAAAIVEAGIEFDQLIYEGAWLHLGLAAGVPRRQVLTAIFVTGGVVYTPGIA